MTIYHWLISAIPGHDFVCSTKKNINGIVQAQRWRWAMQVFAETGAISFRPVFFCQPFRGPCLIWVYNPSVLLSQSENQLTNLIDPGFQAEGYPATAGRLTKGFWMTTFLVYQLFFFLESESQVEQSDCFARCSQLSMPCDVILSVLCFFPDGCHFF